MLAVFSNLVGCAIQASACVFLLAPLVLLAASGTCANCKVEQLLVLAFMSFRLVDPTYNVGLVFFGFYCLLIGYFILKVSLPASNSGGADRACRLGFVDLSGAAPRNRWQASPSVSHC